MSMRHLFLILLPMICQGTLKADSGHQRVSHATEQFIRNEVLKELGINEKVTAIYQFNAQDIQDHGSENLIATNDKMTYPFTYAICLCELWFSTLPYEIKLFLATHEAMHIIKGHLDIAPWDPNNPSHMQKARAEEDEADLGTLFCYASPQKRKKLYQGALAFLKRSHNHPAKPLDSHRPPAQRAALLTAAVRRHHASRCV